MSQSSTLSFLAWPIAAVSTILAGVGFYLYSDAITLAETATSQAQASRQVEKASLTKQSDLQRQLNTAIYDFEQRQQAFSELQQQLTQLQQKTEQQQQEWQAKQEQWLAKLTETAAKDADLSQAQLQIESLTSELSVLNEQLLAAQASLEQAGPSADVIQLQQQFEQLMSENQELKTNLDMQIADKTQLSMTLADARNEIIRLDQQIQQADARINELSMTLELEPNANAPAKMEVKVDSPAVVVPSNDDTVPSGEVETPVVTEASVSVEASAAVAEVFVSIEPSPVVSDAAKALKAPVVDDAVVAPEGTLPELIMPTVEPEAIEAESN
ncbi:hypothetical protein K6Y31_17425 [Motilimonas cestriensis]|uniref:Chromosome segregation ATPase n=1 Tax=Motilimonas cestriensis TaxID=2742685 RepID=A0ABS8WC10_9GAMM|nr:hypothetical protein [Motilimonas cestriensis]MCE2596572.1 hypothetical protein [Motilimonas cestriensis]